MKTTTTHEGILTVKKDYCGGDYYYLDNEYFNKILEDFIGQTVKVTIEVVDNG